METLLWAYIVAAFVVLVVGTFCVIDLAGGSAKARRRAKERYAELDAGHERLIWALAGLLDAVEDGDLMPATPEGATVIREARKLWRSEFHRVDGAVEV